MLVDGHLICFVSRRYSHEQYQIIKKQLNTCGVLIILQPSIHWGGWGVIDAFDNIIIPRVY